MKIKKYLRRFVPVSRTYVDAKIKDLESTYTNQIEKQSALFNQLTNYQSASFDEIIQQLSSLETHITKQQQNNIQNLLHHITTEHNRIASTINDHLDWELKRRDRWKTMSAENKRSAGGRPIWVIKCPAPEGKDKVLWGLSLCISSEKVPGASELFCYY